MMRSFRSIRPIKGALFLCLFVGISVPGESKGDDQEKPEPITFVAYNLKNYLAMDRRVDGETKENAPKPENEITELIKAIVAMKPDILGVCEIGDPDYLADFQKRLKTAGIDLPHTELVRAKSGYDRNLALLSRFPIVATNSNDNYVYDIGDIQKMPFQRGVLEATVAVNPTYHLRLVGLHLKSKREIPEANQAEMRLNEARLARQHIDKILAAEPGANLIVYGDFNDLRIEPPVKTLQGKFGRADYLSSLTLDDQYGFRWTHHWSFADDYSRLDYILLSKGVSPEVDRPTSHIYHWDKWDTASDHRPLVVKITPEDR